MNVEQAVVEIYEKKLDAEREKTKVAEDTMAWHLREAADLRRQLAAAVEGLKGIRAVIRGGIRYPEIFIKDVEKICDAALAKIGEGK